MADVFVVSCVYLVIFLYVCEHWPHISSAQPEGHAAVADQMCVDLPAICPCNAHILVVEAGSMPIPCGTTQQSGRFVTRPHIEPPDGVVIDEVFLTHYCVGYVR